MSKICFMLLIVGCSVNLNSADAYYRSNSDSGRSITERHLNKADMAAVRLAIQDEIYDFGQQKYYFVGASSKSNLSNNTFIHIYINPTLDKDGYGKVIYNNLPYGEIIRLFRLSRNDLIVLSGGPTIGFPVTQPNHLTKFEDIKDIEKMKLTWISQDIVVESGPSAKMIRKASLRQVARIGRSHYLKIWR